MKYLIDDERENLQHRAVKQTQDDAVDLCCRSACLRQTDADLTQAPGVAI
jgi:hypothetical protein